MSGGIRSIGDARNDEAEQAPEDGVDSFPFDFGRTRYVWQYFRHAVLRDFLW